MIGAVFEIVNIVFRTLPPQNFVFICFSDMLLGDFGEMFGEVVWTRLGGLRVDFERCSDSIWEGFQRLTTYKAPLKNMH